MIQIEGQQTMSYNLGITEKPNVADGLNFVSKTQLLSLINLVYTFAYSYFLNNMVLKKEKETKGQP